MAGAAGCPASEINADTRIGTLVAWDSLAHMRVVLAIEDLLGKELNVETMIGIESVADIARILDSHADEWCLK